MFRPDGSLLPHHQCPMADVLRTGISVREREVHIERPDGSRGIALVDIEAVKDSEGNIVGAVNCFQDVTERKLAEDAALRLAAIVESSDDAIVGKDLDGVITSWNAGAERIFGYAAEEIIGKRITILIPPDYQKEEEAIIERIHRGQRVEPFGGRIARGVSLVLMTSTQVAGAKSFSLPRSGQTPPTVAPGRTRRQRAAPAVRGLNQTLS